MSGKPRKVHVRTKTGCLTCRSRRKKCDERKPVCTGCSRNFISCTWPVSQDVQRSSKSIPKDALLPFPLTAPLSDGSSSSISNGSYPVSSTSDIESFNCTQTGLSHPTHTALDIDGEDEEDGTVIQWRPVLHPLSYVSQQRAVSLTPTSLILLQHYIETTSTFLVAKPPTHNPFVTVLLPLAFSDDLLMHSILTLSGTHLAFKKAHDLDIRISSHQHYSLLLRNLRAVLAAEVEHNDIRRTLRLLLVLVVVCQAEALSGRPNGSIFAHLRACRELVLKVLRHSDSVPRGDMKLIQGFTLEVYFWLVMVNNITPYRVNGAHSLPFDPISTNVDFLQEYDTYGIFFNCGLGLFEMIPAVSIFAMSVLAQDSVGDEKEQTFAELNKRLVQWQSPPVSPEMKKWEAQHIATGELFRQALLIFVKTAMSGSSVISPKMIAAIQRQVDIAIPLFDQVAESPYITLLLWPILIIGSCLIHEHQRALFILMLRYERRIEVCQIREAANLLDYLWQDEDEHCYGPYGLHLVMQKRQIIFTLS